ncbi:ferredoxin-type protein NapF [Sinorhizobium sp. BG8]|uniref:ferredoxin-type protein NapF n=1 Tax=Sinorhizobium sp. BG8 TaxID=2613773 RepID=UPI00193DC0D0|nr:ferredoxin-type protein NapF [Sinorhizobium sp. BG8]QRM57140.1 ferredoxin-type protein NapF [Sinorhizobium sp. BG8]
MQQDAMSRREFLRGSRRSEAVRIRPPGVSEDGLTACTGCGKCVEHCPTAVIDLADGLPVINFSKGECTFCGACAANCPEPVFTEDKPSRFDHVITIATTCLPFHHVDCQSCRDVCPTGAIRFHPVRGGPFVPDLVAEACTGCGACISVCPVGAVATTPPSMEAAHA